MKVAWKRVAALLVMCLLLVPLCAGSVLAMDLERENSLTVHLTIGNDEVDPAEAGLVIDLYKVADAVKVPGYDMMTFEVKKGSLYDHTYTYYDPETDDETEIGMNDLIKLATEGTYSWDVITQELFRNATGYINEMMRSPDVDEPVVSGASFDLPMENLTSGLYMVVARSADMENYLRWLEWTDNGISVFHLVSCGRDMNYEYFFSPQLVYLPYKEADENGNIAWYDDWLYDAEINLKGEREALSQKKLILHKVDEDGRTPLAGATFDLYATRVASDEIPEDTITTYVDGIGYVTLYKIAQNLTTDSNGNIELIAPLWDDNTLYAWVETRAPAGYELDPTPQFCFAYVPGEYTSDLANGYAEYMNNQGKPLLHYDPAYPNAAGGVTFERWVQSGENHVRLNGTEDKEVFVRVKAYSNSEGVYDGQGLGSYEVIASGEGWTYVEVDGYYYYNNILGGEGERTTNELCFRLEPDYGERIRDSNGDPLPYQARLAVVYDIVPVQYNEDGSPYADWSMEYDGGEGGQNRVPGDAGYQTMAVVRPGFEIETAEDVKFIAQRHYVRSSYYSAKDPGGVEPIVVTNKKKTENPPEEPGMELPETGGTGTVAFFLAGSGLMAISLFLLMMKKRKLV